MSFIKRHWFGLLVSMPVVFFTFFLVLILIAPKQDAQGRGFVQCTQSMAEDLLLCDKRPFCTIRAILSNTACDIGVIADGMVDWTKGTQPTPWSNYIFEPDVSSPFIDEEARSEYLKNYPDTKAEMERLHILRKDLENEQDTSEEQAPWNQK